MKDTLPVTAVIINHKTPELLTRALGSTREFYPALRILLIDNGSNDGRSLEVMSEWQKRCPEHTEILINRSNLHHGPAMDQALRHLSSPFVLFIDSDCHVLKGGFVEKMAALAETSALCYAVGKRVWMDQRGFDISPESPGAIPYVRPICMLIRRSMYLSLPNAERHGTPFLANMREAARRGYQLVDFPIERYISHMGRGTAGRYGYGLGWKGKLNFFLHKLGL